MSQTQPVDTGIELVRRYTEEVFNGRNYDVIPEIQGEEFVQHGPWDGMEIRGSEESQRNTELFHAAFSDLKATEEFTFSDGEYVCTMYTYTGTHDGDLMGIPATDEHATVRGVAINRIEDGKIAETWTLPDFLSLFQQVGMIPEIDEMAA